MGSDAPPRRPDEELAAIDDPDFGNLRLIREWFHSKPHGGGAWAETHMHSWIGALAGASLNISVSDAGPFPELRPELRGALKRLASDPASFKRNVAWRMLERAREGAENGDPPTLESLEAALSLTAVRVEPAHEVFLYFSETAAADATIFAGHVIEVRCKLDGTVKEAHLTG